MAFVVPILAFATGVAAEDAALDRISAAWAYALLAVTGGAWVWAVRRIDRYIDRHSRKGETPLPPDDVESWGEWIGRIGVYVLILAAVVFYVAWLIVSEVVR